MKMFNRTARQWLVSTAANLKALSPSFSAHSCLEQVIQRPHDPGTLNTAMHDYYMATSELGLKRLCNEAERKQS